MYGGVTRRGRGQVGIGTLIVFIAMVLVAAMAAGVLVNTAGLLENEGDVVSSQSSQRVTDHLVVTSSLGHVTPEVNDGRTKSGGDAEENESVDVVKLTVGLAPGAGTVNLSKATIQWVGPNRTTTLVHGTTADHEPTADGSDSGTFSASDLNPSPDDGDDGSGDGDPHQSFNTYSINSDEHAVLQNRDQRVNIYLNASQIESGSAGGTADSDSQPLAAGTTVSLEITTASGATTVYRLDVPQSLAEETFVSL